MSKKNTYILKTLILLCTTVASSFYVLSTPPGQRGPNQRSNRARQVPAPVQPAPVPVQSAPIPTPALQPAEQQAQPSFAKASDSAKATSDTSEDRRIEKITAPVEEKETEEELDQTPEPKTTTVSQARNVQTVTALPASSGWLASAYATVVPIILVTLDKAVGGGIAASTKSAIKLFGARHTFNNLKNEAQEEAKKIVESGEFEQSIWAQANEIMRKKNISEDSKAYGKLIKEVEDQIARPKQEKINYLAKNFLIQQKIDPDTMEKTTSLSSILGQTISTGILNTIIPMIGTFIGYGVTLSLQGLMPAQQQ